MTVYWWTHWFWITVIVTATMKSLHGYPQQPRGGYDTQRMPIGLNTNPFHTPSSAAAAAAAAKAAEREPLTFPRPAIGMSEFGDNGGSSADDGSDDGGDDTDDVFNGRSLIPATFSREWLNTRRDVPIATEVLPKQTAVPTTLLVSSTTTTTTTLLLSTTARPTMAAASRATTSVPDEDVIATRLSTRKRPAYEPDMAQVTRVNVTLIRSAARLNKTTNLLMSASSLATTTSNSSSSSATKQIRTVSNTSRSSVQVLDPTSPELRATDRSDEQSIQIGMPQPSLTSRSASTSASSSSSSSSGGASGGASDEDRHNYTNDLSMRPVAGVGKVANDKASSSSSSSALPSPPSSGGGGGVNVGGRQSKVLLGSGSILSVTIDSAQPAQQREQQRSALDANLVNYTGGGTKSLLAEVNVPMAMNAVARSDGDDDGGSRSMQVKRSIDLDAGAISGICLAAVALCGFVSAAGMLMYRRRFVNKPETLSEPDSTGYIDDSINRDNSDEMYSLDNDSFLNSLEAMTIQNYWTENVKHTKL